MDRVRARPRPAVRPVPDPLPHLPGRPPPGDAYPQTVRRSPWPQGNAYQSVPTQSVEAKARARGRDDGPPASLQLRGRHRPARPTRARLTRHHRTAPPTPAVTARNQKTVTICAPAPARPTGARPPSPLTRSRSPRHPPRTTGAPRPKRMTCTGSWRGSGGAMWRHPLHQAPEGSCPVEDPAAGRPCPSCQTPGARH